MNSLKKRKRRNRRLSARKSSDTSQYLGSTSRDFSTNFKNVYAPTNFSFISNPKEVVGFIESLRKYYDKEKKVFVHLANVKQIDFDAIVVLLSIMIKFKARGIKFNGDRPIDDACDDILNKSGFFNRLYNYNIKEKDTYTIKTANIFTHANKQVDSGLWKKLRSDITNFLWDDNKRCPGIQRSLIECMLNTNNHAAGFDKKGEKHWWLSIQKIENTQRVKFTFVDYGIGIFESLNKKTSTSKWYGWFEKLTQKTPFSGNTELLNLILNGDFHATVTGKSYRGKGLPGIKEAVDRNQISNLFVISNDVYADVSKNIYRKLEKDFSGTFIQWELNSSNEFIDAA